MSENTQVTAQRFVIVTGAAGGIGQAMVQEFAANGYTVIATDLGAEPLGLGAHHYLQADLARTVEDESYAEEIFSQIRIWLGQAGLTALINNAAVQILGGADSLTRTDWQQTMNVNLVAPFIWTQALLPALEGANGSVVNVSSIHARLTKKNFVAYATSKAALSGMTRSLAVDVGARIRVNAIEPAAIDTPLLRAGFASNEVGYLGLKQFHPANKIGTPEELAKLTFAIVGLPSKFFNGSVIAFDGGIGSALHDPS
jgi:NAD(P)-dependent dehydrogenase (short-subunit alcohol dehydrogenase family)